MIIIYIVQDKRKIVNIFRIEPGTHIKDKKVVAIFVKFKWSLKNKCVP